MAQFSQLVVTNQGKELIARTLTGTGGIKLTRVKASSASYKEDELEGLAELAGIEQEAAISRISRPSETVAKVEAAISNEGAAAGYYMRAIGLYAIDPAAGEILFAATVETSGSCHVPAYNGSAVSGAYIKLFVGVSNSEAVSLAVDPAAAATVGDIIELRKLANRRILELAADGWSDAYPYSQTVEAEGATAGDDAKVIGVYAPADAALEQVKAWNKAAGCLMCNPDGVADGTITFKAFKKPAVDFRVITEGV